MSGKKKCVNCGLLIDNDMEKCPYCGSLQKVDERQYEDNTGFVEVINEEPKKEKPKYFHFNSGQKLVLWKQIVFIAIGLFGISLLATIYQSIVLHFFPTFIEKPEFSLIGNCGLYTLLFIVFLILSNKDLGTLFGKFKKGRTWLFGLGYGFLLIVFSEVYGMLANLIYPSGGSNVNQNAIIQLVNNYPIFSLIVLGIFGPICEEYTYRLGLFSLLSRKSKKLAYIITPIIFGLIHFNFGPGIDIVNELIQLPEYIICGLFLAYIFDKEGVETSITTHCLNNLTSIIVIILATYAL